MKTLIENTNKEIIQNGLKNKSGMIINNTKEVRTAVASELHLMLRKIQSK
jgi:hypothetical protein